jgi:hypothetical protein
MTNQERRMMKGGSPLIIRRPALLLLSFRERSER